MAPLRAKIIISFILLIVLLMLPDEATSQRRRRGMIASNTAQTDSLNRKDSLGADTVVVRVDSVAPTKKQPLDAPVIYESNDSTTFTLGGAATLYGSGKVNYQNIELAAEVISMNLDSSKYTPMVLKTQRERSKVNLSLKKVKLHTIQKQSVITSRARKRESPISSLSRVKVM